MKTTFFAFLVVLLFAGKALCAQDEVLTREQVKRLIADEAPATLWQHLSRAKGQSDYDELFWLYADSFAPADYLDMLNGEVRKENKYESTVEGYFMKAMFWACERGERQVAERIRQKYAKIAKRDPIKSELFKMLFARNVDCDVLDGERTGFFWFLPNDGKKTCREIKNKVSMGYTEEGRYSALREPGERRDRVWIQGKGQRVTLTFDPRGETLIFFAPQKGEGLAFLRITQRYPDYVWVWPVVKLPEKVLYHVQLFLLPIHDGVPEANFFLVRDYGERETWIKQISWEDAMGFPTIIFRAF